MIGGVPDGGSEEELPRLYTDLAEWWHLLSIPEDYDEEAADIRQRLEDHVDGGIQTLLELGSGGGNNASFLKEHYMLTLVDRSSGMLAASKRLNPQVEHIQGDMRTVRLGRVFDAVLIHDAIMYMTTREDLRMALETAYEHLRPGGAAIFLPDFVKETFHPGTEHGGHDGEDGRGIRYLSWTWDPDSEDEIFVSDFAYLMHQADGTLESTFDRHSQGLFRRQVWLDLLTEVGFTATVEEDPFEREVFLGVKPPKVLRSR